MTETARTGARARRGAGNEPKRKRARDDERQPLERLAAPNTNRPMTPGSVEEAVRLQAGAALKREVGRSMIDDYGDHTGGRFELAEASDMEAAAEKFLDPLSHVTGPIRIGNGGEVVVATQQAMSSTPGVIDTVRESPGMLSASASMARLSLTGNALITATDAANSIQAKNSLEKMLAHEMAAAHRLGMMFIEQSSNLLERYNFDYSDQRIPVEAARLANAAGRMMTAFQDGLLTLDRIRRGGRQTVKVIHQHVAVEAGGQAVVAGSTKAGGRKSRGRGPASK